MKTHVTRDSFWQLFCKNSLAVWSLFILTMVLLLILFTPFLPLVDPNITAPTERLIPPFHSHFLLGSDHLGRDILSRLLWGTRMSIFVSVYATIIAAIIGSTIGILAAYFGNWLDNLLMRVIDMIMAFPYILLALGIVAILGPGLMNAMFAITLVSIPFFARNIRGVALSIVNKDFILSARLSGKHPLQIIISEILPNVLPVITVTMATTLGWMILETAGLSFLGLGAQPPQSDLGSMLGEGRKLLYIAPYLSIIPGLMIFLLVICINLISDGIRDLLDPRLAGGVYARPSAKTQDIRHTNPKTKQQPNTLLSIQNLSVEFHLNGEVFQTVRDINLSIKAGQCVGLVGESGSGKSVCAQTILGLTPSPPGKITQGAIMWQNHDLIAMDLHQLQKIRGKEIAYIFQDPATSLHPLIPIGQQIAEAICCHQTITPKMAFKQAISLLKTVAIPNASQRAYEYPHELSGGMRQRALIAMALANQAKLLIADEPTTALDVTVQAQILSLLKKIQTQHNLAILIITHDFGVVSNMCDDIHVMYAGQIVESGPTATVLSAPAHPYTQKLLNCIPILGQTNHFQNTLTGTPLMTNSIPKGCSFAPRCPYVDISCQNSPVALELITPKHDVRCIKPLRENDE